MANRVIGKIAMTPKGDWNSLIPYEILDVVTNNNVMYVALKDVPAGTPTTDLTYWLRLIAGSGGIAPDTQMSDSSANPVENRVIKSYVDTEIQSTKDLIGDKVDKEIGKGLSSNDYTNTDKEKVDLVGSGTLTTTAQTLIGAINEHESNIQTFDIDIVNLKEEVESFADSIDNKVDKVDGKGLSSNDFTTAYINKINSLKGVSVSDLTASSVSISAGTSNTYTINTSKSGYTAIGIISVTPSSNTCVVVRFSLNSAGTQATVILSNVATTSKNCSLTIRVLYVQN